MVVVEAGRLTSVLDAIQASAISESCKRRLLHRAVELALLPAQAMESPSPGVETRLEETLATIALAPGVQGRMSVPKALQWLRSTGGKKLASRLSAMSKGRNSFAHPDVRFCDVLHQHLEDLRGDLLPGGLLGHSTGCGSSSDGSDLPERVGVACGNDAAAGTSFFLHR